LHLDKRSVKNVAFPKRFILKFQYLNLGKTWLNLNSPSMEAAKESFSAVEYLSIFTAFIFGYVATRFFSGWSAMINFRHAIKFSKEHLAWTLLTFGLLIDVWWGSWIKGTLINRQTIYYVSLLSPIIFYILSVLLFPPLSDDRFLDLRKYFHSIHNQIYLVYISLFISFVINDFFFKPGVETNYYFNGSAIMFAFVGIFSRPLMIQRGILVAGWSMLLVHIVMQPPILVTNIDGFSLAEYLTVFIAFIYGFVASRFFSGWGFMITKFHQITFSKEHVAWTLLAFGLLMDFWTGSWQRESYISLNINYFLLSLTLPMIFYAVVAVSFPNVRNDEKIDLREFYLSHKKIIYGLMACSILSNAVIANFMEERNLLSEENIYRLIAIVLALLAAFSHKQIMERIVLVLGWVVLLTHLFATEQ